MPGLAGPGHAVADLLAEQNRVERAFVGKLVRISQGTHNKLLVFEQVKINVKKILLDLH